MMILVFYEIHQHVLFVLLFCRFIIIETSDTNIVCIMLFWSGNNLVGDRFQKNCCFRVSNRRCLFCLNENNIGHLQIFSIR